MAPQIANHARIAFRHLAPEARQEAVQECLANATVAFVRLVQLHKADIAYPTVLARFAIAQLRDGRRVGGHLNIQDISSAYCQRAKKITVERLDHFDEEENAWQEAVIVDTKAAPVSEIVAFRCDFSDWLKRLPKRNRRIAEFLALGNRTSDTARKFRVSEGRVSQLRRELAGSWQRFQSEATTAPAAAVA
jgi:hypothetical protein